MCQRNVKDALNLGWVIDAIKKLLNVTTFEGITKIFCPLLDIYGEGMITL